MLHFGAIEHSCEGSFEVNKSENSCDFLLIESEVENGGGSNEMCDVYYRMCRCAARK